MKKQFFILAFLISALGFSQTKVQMLTHKTITSTQRDAYTVPDGEYPEIYNSTTDQKECWDGDSWEPCGTPPTTINNTLTSTATDEALSANMGKTLKDDQDTQQTAIDLNTAKTTFPGFTDLATDYSVTLSTVATTNSYDDLDDKPTIPTNNNELTNGAGYIASEVDGSTTNELNTSVSMSAGSLRVIDAGGTKSVNLISTDNGNVISAGSDGKLYSAGASTSLPNGNLYVPTSSDWINNTNTDVSGGNFIVPTVDDSASTTVTWDKELDYTQDFIVSFKFTENPEGTSSIKRGLNFRAVSDNSLEFGFDNGTSADYWRILGNLRTDQIYVGAGPAVWEETEVFISWIDGVMNLGKNGVVQWSGIHSLTENVRISFLARQTGFKDIKLIDLSNSPDAGSDPTTDASDLTSGVLADARVQESNVTQHEAALTIDGAQLTGMSAYLTTPNAASTYEPIKGSDDNFVTDAEKVVIGNTSGTNTGDQTSIIGITGTKSQYNTSVTDGTFLYVGDISVTDTDDLDFTYSSGAISALFLPTAISGRTAKTTLAGTEEVLINDSGTLKKTTAQAIADLASGSSNIAQKTITGTADYDLLPADDLIFVDNSGAKTITIDTDANSSFVIEKLYTFIFKTANQVTFDFLSGVTGTDFVTYSGTKSVTIMRIDTDEWEVLNAPSEEVDSYKASYYNQSTEPTGIGTQLPNTTTFIPDEDMMLNQVILNGTLRYYWVEL